MGHAAVWQEGLGGGEKLEKEPVTSLTTALTLCLGWDQGGMPGVFFYYFFTFFTFLSLRRFYGNYSIFKGIGKRRVYWLMEREIGTGVILMRLAGI